MPIRRLLILVVTVLVLLPQAATAMPIEGFARYQPQTHCSPHPKPGTLRLAAWLQRKYPGSGSLGISRSCRDGGVSEHKEGRAFDWEVSVHSARDRGYVRDFMSRIFATDAAGNADALARRMGIMYLIWNDHIYGSYSGFRKRAYLNSGCRSRRHCSQTLRHRDHVHISLTRRGGKGLTSWYTKRAPSKPAAKPAAKPPAKPAPRPAVRPAPKPAPKRATKPPAPAYTRLTVPTDGRVRATHYELLAGHRYTITAAGVFTYGTPRQVADPACVWSVRARGWRPHPSRSVGRRHGSLDLRVNGTKPFGGVCHPASHVYRAVFVPKHTRTLSLAVANRGNGSGRLVVTVSDRRGVDVTAALPTYPALRPAPAPSTRPSRGFGLLSETVAVPAGSEGASTAGEVQAGATYRVTVSGTVGLGHARSDGACVKVRGSWYASASLDPRFPDQRHGRLYVDGVPFAGAGGCGTHRHTTSLTATRTGRLRLSLWDPLTRRDNSGALIVQVQRLTAIPVPTAAAARAPRRTWAWQQGRDWFALASDRADGVTSTMRLRKGETVEVVVRGTQRSGSTPADASCVQTSGGWLPRDPGMALDQDPLDVWVDGSPVTWRALGRTPGCSDEHAYSTRFTARKDGPLRFAVLDLDHRDNSGTLGVTLLRD